MTFELKKSIEEDLKNKKEDNLKKISKTLEPLEDLVKSIEGKNLHSDYTAIPSIKDKHPILEFIPNEEKSKTVEDYLQKQPSELSTKFFSKMYDLTINYMIVTDKDFWKFIGKKTAFKAMSKGYIATTAGSEKINNFATIVSKNIKGPGLLGVKGYIHRLAIDLENVTNKENLEDIREYLKEITFSDKYNKEKEQSKQEAFEELKKPEHRLGPRVAKKVSKLASIKEEYIPKTLKSAKRIRENISAIGLGLILGGQIYKRQAGPAAEVMDTTIDMVAKSDFITSYCMCLLTGAQLAIPIMVTTGQGFWSSYAQGILATNLETKARSEIFRRTGTYLPAPTKLITPTTAITLALTTLHEGYHFILDTEEKLDRKSEGWRTYKKEIGNLAKNTFGQIDNEKLNSNQIKQDFKEIYTDTF